MDNQYTDPLVVSKGVVRWGLGDVYISGTYQRQFGWNITASAVVGSLDTAPATPTTALLAITIPDELNDDVDEFHTGQDTLEIILAWVDELALATNTPAQPSYPAQLPVPSFTVDLDEIDEAQSVQFTNTSTYGSAALEDATFAWDFDGGAAPSTDASPLVQFDTAGEYDVTLTVTTPYGEVVSAATTIIVNVP